VWPGADRTDPMPGLSVNVGEAGGRVGAQRIFTNMPKNSDLGSFSSSTKLVQMPAFGQSCRGTIVIGRSFFTSDTSGNGHLYHECCSLQVHSVR
jgi:hypothetical protein